MPDLILALSLFAILINVAIILINMRVMWLIKQRQQMRDNK